MSPAEDLSSVTTTELLAKRAALQLEISAVESELENRRTEHAKGDPSGLRLLSNADILRYSRHLLLPEFGVRGQLSLKLGRVLVVGCGGLGCPAAQFLASCGLEGSLGLVDYDVVEVGNLHRQVLHSEARVGMNKAESVRKAVRDLNSSVNVRVFGTVLNSSNVMEVIKDFDVVLDATDNVATRYLLNDACVLAGKPLVSGSALRFEGQLTVYNYRGGPTYRCLFPVPPPPETVTNCSDGGVLGAIPGVIGTLQALEAVKIVSGIGEVLSGRMLLFDGLSGTFRTVRLRGRKEEEETAKVRGLVDYEQFCGASASDKESPLTILDDEGSNDRVSASALDAEMRGGKSSFVLVDVRTRHETEICSLPGSINIPLSGLDAGVDVIREEVAARGADSIYVLCRRGNDSQRAVMRIRQCLLMDSVKVKDVRGGLHAWAKEVDHDFPIY